MLNDEQYQRLQHVLEALEPELGRIYERGRSFVEDQIKRFALYQQDTRMSDRQWKWLEDLYREFAAEVDVADKMGVEGHEADLDDEFHSDIGERRGDYH